MDVIEKILTGFDTPQERKQWEARLARIRKDLETVPVGIFMAGSELKTVLQLHGVETRTNGQADGINPDHVTLVENRISKHKQSL